MLPSASTTTLTVSYTHLVQEPKDAAEDARSQFEEHLRAVRAQNTEDAAAENTAAEDAEADADTADEAEGREELEVAEAVVEASENKSENAHSASEAEEIHTVEDMKAARTHAAVTEAQNAGLDDLAAAYAARLGITLDSEEETFVEVASDEAIAEETAADKATTEAPEPAEATESVEAVSYTHLDVYKRQVLTVSASSSMTTQRRTACALG